MRAKATPSITMTSPTTIPMSRARRTSTLLLTIQSILWPSNAWLLSRSTTITTIVKPFFNNQFWYNQAVTRRISTKCCYSSRRSSDQILGRNCVCDCQYRRCCVINNNGYYDWSKTGHYRSDTFQSKFSQVFVGQGRSLRRESFLLLHVARKSNDNQHVSYFKQSDFDSNNKPEASDDDDDDDESAQNVLQFTGQWQGEEDDDDDEEGAHSDNHNHTYDDIEYIINEDEESQERLYESEYIDKISTIKDSKDSIDSSGNVDDDDGSNVYQEWQQWMQAVESSIKAWQRKITSLENELAKSAELAELRHRAQLLTANLYMFKPGVTTATVPDWESLDKNGQPAQVQIKWDSKQYDSAAAQADAWFQLARKKQRGAKVVREKLQESNLVVGQLSEMRNDLCACQTNNQESNESINTLSMQLVQVRLVRTSNLTGFKQPNTGVKSKNNNKITSSRVSTASSSSTGRTKTPALGTPASNVRKFISPNDCIILVGRNRRGNEYLSLTIARGDDIWMHSRGVPGAHVVLMQRRGSPQATESCLQMAANLAAFYSDARNENSTTITLAQPKHILKPRRAPLGAVSLRQEERVITGYANEVPDECKRAREESGQENIDSYRATDKAKRRQQTTARTAKTKAQQKKAARKSK